MFNKILLAEDEVKVRTALESYLYDLLVDVEVVTAGTVDETLEIVTEHFKRRDLFDLAILDCKLPRDEDDADPDVHPVVARRIRDLMPRTVIVFYSGYSQDESVRDMVEGDRKAVRKMIEAELVNPLFGTPVLVPKGLRGWTAEVGRVVQKCLAEKLIRLGFVSRRFPDYVPQTTSSISISLPERN